MQQLLSKMYLTTGEPVIKGAPVTTEARAIPEASATTEVQNNSAEVQNDSASDSDPVDAEAPAIILIPLEHCCEATRWSLFNHFIFFLHSAVRTNDGMKISVQF